MSISPTSEADAASRSVALSVNSGPSAGSSEFINFAIGDDQYGVDIMSVREIKEWSKVTHLPKQPDYVRGVLNLRGNVVPIIDLRRRFGQDMTECTPTHIIIIVQIEDRQVGLLADKVLDIVAFERNQMQPIPDVARSSRARFLSGLAIVERSMIALIDLPQLLGNDGEISESLHVLPV